MATATARRRGTSQGAGNGESANVTGYFKQVFAQNPAWLRTKNNQPALEKYAADHGLTEIPENVKATLANVKSQLKRGKRGAGRRGRQAGATGALMTIPTGGGMPALQIGNVKISAERGRMNISFPIA